MRVADRPIPSIVGPHPPTPPHPADLFVGIERLPLAAYTWDDDDTATKWDAAGLVWDDPSAVAPGQLYDATCSLAGMVIDHPGPDEQGRFAASTVTMTLANADGAWSQYDESGRLVFYAPGRRVDVWARYSGADHWLFSGAVARWAEQPDATVEIEAVDAFANLNQGIGEWQPGSYGQKPGDRLGAIATLVTYPNPYRFATGQVTLHAWLSTATPLEEMQAVAVSDGGILAVDPDGALLYRDRGWPTGRADQPAVVTVSDNLCTADAVVWDLTITTDDELANIVQLTNLEALTVEARGPASIDRYRRHTLEHTGDQWVTVAEGVELAAFLLAQQQPGPLRVDSFTLYLHDPQQVLWPIGVELRRGDMIRLLHQQPAVGGTDLVDVNVITTAIRHELTPTTWVTQVGTTRAVSTNQQWRWDDPAITWDDPTDPPEWTY